MGDHSEGVADLAEAVARHMDIGDEGVREVRAGAELHDIGKAAIPDAILSKPGPLDADEWAFMRRHTIIGERIVASASALAGVSKLVRSSHERWDGSGYPDGLAGDEIPLGARIIFVCDAFDAMLADRPDSAALEFESALAELERCAGGQFDPQVVTAFVAVARARAVNPLDASAPLTPLQPAGHSFPSEVRGHAPRPAVRWYASRLLLASRCRTQASSTGSRSGCFSRKPRVDPIVVS